MKRCLTASITLIFSMAAFAQPNPQLRRGSAFGTFSSLQMVEESGDLIGYEIVIFPQFKTAYLTFQCAEGAPTQLELAPVEVHGNKISFDITDDQNSCHGHYEGEIDAKGLCLRTSSDNAHEFLPRRPSYWSR